jgi:hypothetical protein
LSEVNLGAIGTATALDPGDCTQEEEEVTRQRGVIKEEDLLHS